jgi:phosphatidylglycerophosphate synthase
MSKHQHPTSYYIINGITLYRIVTAPLLVWLLFSKEYTWFKWLLGASFFTDLIDGFLARRFKITSILGTRLDSIGDDLTVLVALMGLFVMQPDFFQEQKAILIPLLLLFVIQTGAAFYRYGRITSFHTWMAKTAALAQGIFLLCFFFFGEIYYPLFYAAAFITIIELAEEIVLVGLLPTWEANVKGLWWVWKRKR